MAMSGWDFSSRSLGREWSLVAGPVRARTKNEIPGLLVPYARRQLAILSCTAQRLFRLNAAPPSPPPLQLLNWHSFPAHIVLIHEVQMTAYVVHVPDHDVKKRASTRFASEFAVAS